MYQCPQQYVAKTVQKYELCCFRAGKSTVRQIQSMGQISGAGAGGDKKRWSMSVHSPSMNFKATDVTINRQKLVKVIKHFKISW